MPKQKPTQQTETTSGAPIPLAVQLYTLRTLTRPADDLLGEVAAIGYDGVELAGTYGLSAEDLRAVLDKHGLRVSSAHVGLADLEADLPGVIKYHKAVGNDTLIVPWLAMDLRGSSGQAWTGLGQRLNLLGKRCRSANMRLLYHNHDFEMVEIEGRLAIDWLMEGADAENLGFEIDVAWVVRGGQDAPAMLARYAGRCSRIHVKDLGDNPDEKGFADVGHGKLDWGAILPAAQAAGVEWLIVEHDQPTDPMASIRRSYAFLSGQR